jgi:hypothetical protein
MLQELVQLISGYPLGKKRYETCSKLLLQQLKHAAEVGKVSRSERRLGHPDSVCFLAQGVELEAACPRYARGNRIRTYIPRTGPIRCLKRRFRSLGLAVALGALPG